ncbi:MAG: DnaJ C-terminal domain-containing protein, partial [Bradymonadia bacterium]
DLSLDVPITVLQAITGGRVEVLTPEGGQVRLSIPKHCQSGQRLRLRGKGMTKKGGRGNLYVHIQIQVPHVDDPACIAAAEALEQFYAAGAGDEPATES